METVEAVVEEVGEKHFLTIDPSARAIRIPISEDDAVAVKAAFNQLILRMKSGAFKIELGDVGEDLFSQVANEYVKQLNVEILEVRGEMVALGLADG